MARHPTRNRIVAGAFLLAMLALGVAILVVVGGWQTWLEPKQTIDVRFEAAPNIKIGSPVLLAGHPVGRVYDIGLVEVACPPERAGGGKCYMVRVVAELPKRYRVYQNARVTIKQMLVGQSALINIEDVGYGDPVKDYLVGEQESPFAGAASELGIGVEEKKNLSQILQDVRAAAEVVRQSLPEILDKLKTTSANLAEVSGRAKATLGRIDGVLDDNRENLKAAVASARALTDDARKKTDEVLENLKTATGKLNAILDENRPDVRKTITSARAFMEKADTGLDDILANVKTASADLKAAVADLRVIASDAKALVATNRANITATAQNFRETSAHLKALAKEVRRAPWRLFATPDKEEVESINLYDAARAFAAAATDLEAVADTLETIMEARQKGIEVDPEILQTMLKDLEATFERYNQAEEALLKEYERIQK